MAHHVSKVIEFIIRDYKKQAFLSVCGLSTSVSVTAILIVNIEKKEIVGQRKCAIHFVSTKKCDIIV